MAAKCINKKLTKMQYQVLCESATEKPFTGKLLYNKKSGTYICANCRTPLFKSDTKFDSGSGWPSFYKASNVKEKLDFSAGLPRTEVTCKKCGGHLGHVFRDAPQTPTGMRYCINSAALNFKGWKKKHI